MFAFLISFFIVEPLSFSTMSVFSAPEKTDFSVTDLYAQVADRRPVRRLDNDIVIVDVGHADRLGIASILDEINLWGPRVVGLDVMIGKPLPSDSILLRSLSSIERLILPITLEQEKDSRFSVGQTPYFITDPLLSHAEYAAVNLPAAFEGATIREFATVFPIIGSADSIPSFPLALARAYSPQSVKPLMDRGNNEEVIDYPSREFQILNADDLKEEGETLTDKIVIVGALSDSEDIHSTPINSYMSGLSIHAASTSTILGGRFYDPYSNIPAWLPACLLCFLILLTRELTKSHLRGLITRLLQLIFIYLAVRIGYSLYVDHHLIFNFTYTLLMVAFGFFAADIWSGLLYLGKISFIHLKNLFKKTHPI